ncbi:ribosome silencing factor [Ferrithrix thermotolerans]|uniref:ribosome silencing factor n=1 Tax=Ferrithrix thermotolerans TaxID=209649 RepID=UPI000A04B75D|nr:ribosome silencing factor [Ferrithrix thermotolerans]
MQTGAESSSAICGTVLIGGRYLVLSDRLNGAAWEDVAVDEAIEVISSKDPLNFEDISEQDAEVILVSTSVALVKGGIDPVVLDLRGKHSLIDFLVIITGSSDRHVRSLSETITSQLRRVAELRPTLSEGLKEGNWVLLDYGAILINIFDEETRAFYSLERLWSDASKKAFDPKVLSTVTS